MELLDIMRACGRITTSLANGIPSGAEKGSVLSLNVLLARSEPGGQSWAGAMQQGTLC